MSNVISARKDSIVYKIPMLGDKVVHSGVVVVNGEKRPDSTWLWPPLEMSAGGYQGLPGMNEYGNPGISRVPK